MNAAANANIVKEHITYINNYLRDTNFKYEDFCVNKDSCTFSKLVLHIFERLTIDTATQDLIFVKTSNVPVDTLKATKCFYIVKKVQAILKTGLKCDNTPLRRVRNPDIFLVKQTLAYLKKLTIVRKAIQEEVIQRNREIKERNEAWKAMKEEKRKLEKESNDNNYGFGSLGHDKLFSVLEEISKKTEENEELQMENEGLKNEIEIINDGLRDAKQRDKVLDKDYQHIKEGSSITENKLINSSHSLKNEYNVKKGILASKEEQKKDVQTKMERLLKDSNDLKNIEKFIDEKIVDIKGCNEPLENLDKSIKEECENIEETYQDLFTTENKILNGMSTVELGERDPTNVIRNLYLPMIRERIKEVTKKLDDIVANKEKIFKNNYDLRPKRLPRSRRQIN
uniref:Ndc80-like chromosome segregation protein n=1 Tax=Strongyloides papillosus TaxID=174720 RepID=A0A0N5BI48_STREA